MTTVALLALSYAFVSVLHFAVIDRRANQGETA
jgi:hypothetical protein